MLAKKFRLPSSTVFKNASVFHSPFFSLRTQPNGLSNSRYGFIVSKKVDKSAVMRNSIKRKLRACIESHYLINNKAQDALFVIKAQAKEATQKELLSEIQKFL